MKFITLILAALASLPSAVSAQSVFAHFILGNAGSYTETQWQSDIKLAQEAGIDAFVLNIAPPLVGTTSTQVSNAFKAVNDLGSGFKLFFSFDYLGGGQPWAASDVISLLQTYTPNTAHFKYNNVPLVSTFEGTNNIGDWAHIRASVPGGIFFVPDWSSLGPGGISSQLSIIDGAFSWDMWPNGANNMTDVPDKAWKAALSGKAYMMGVSPWFFTDLPGYNKAWVWKGDDLWHERWQQVLAVKPAFVEIVTWNDYGESHYIGPIYNDGIPRAPNANAHPYVDNMPHDGWRQLLPYYIAQYKSGGIAPTVSKEKVSFWYRLTAAAAGSNGGVTGNNCPSAINLGGYQSYVDPNTVVEDKVFFTVLVKSPSTITVQIGGGTPVTFNASRVGSNHFSTPFNGQTGFVRICIVRNGATVLSSTGAAIQAHPASGVTNYNAWVGGAST